MKILFNRGRFCPDEEDGFDIQICFFAIKLFIQKN